MTRLRRTFATLVAACACVLSSSLASPAVSASGSVADVDAAARAAGNDRKGARELGDAIFATSWPAQITKVRVDRVGGHAVAGLVLSGVKFHHALTRGAFLDEIAGLVAIAFAHGPVEEVDVWTTTPLPYHAHEIVAGDLAMPTSRIVFAVTVRRSEGGAFPARLRAGRDVFWNDRWRNTLATR